MNAPPVRAPALAAFAALAALAALAGCSADDGGWPVDVPRDIRDADDGGGSDLGCTPDEECGDGGTCCPSGCTDLRSDDFNCGECGVECALNEVCERGFCYAPECFPECSSRQICCRGDCVDPMGDDANCGDCGNVCDPPLNCVGGGCMCGSGASARICTLAESCCPSGCTDLMSDPDNCGECGATCGGLPCNMGQCVCGSSTCPPGWSCCEDECFDLQNDPEHCGTCDDRCDSDRSTGCVEGECRCGAEEECPSGTVTYPLCQLSPFMPPYRCCSGTCRAINDDSCTRCGAPCTGSNECQAETGLFSCQFVCAPPE